MVLKEIKYGLDNDEPASENSDDEYSDYETVMSSGQEETQRNENGHDDAEPEIAKEETTAVSMLKVLVVGVMVVAMVGVAILAYYYLRNSEDEHFEASAYDSSHKILNSLGASIDTSLGAVDAFVVSITSYASSSNQSWPFVSIPDHAIRLSKTRGIAKSTVMQQYHLVPEVERNAWEDYAIDHDEWIQEALNTQASDPFVWENKDPSAPIASEKHIYYGEDRTPSPSGQVWYSPTWQSYPVDPSLLTYNWNGLQYSKLAPGIERAIDTGEVVFSNVITFYDSEDQESELTKEWISSHKSPEHDESEPFFQVLYPILDTSVNSDPDRAKVVALVGTTIAWRDMLTGILPETNVGLQVVLENTCGQNFTYQVDGWNATYLGRGDLHDSEYNEHKIESTLAGLEEFQTEPRLYSGLPIFEGYCDYNFRIYPSDETRDTFYSSDPLLFAMAAAFIFIFTSITFLSYDWTVAARQEKVFTTAKQSSAIVQSLFPQNVRDRLYNEQQELDAQRAAAKGVQPTKAKLKNFLNQGEEAQEQKIANSTNRDANGLALSRPIADLFPETTVLFADIANFTAWSSVRDPTQVFTLLEAIYGAFDDIAARRGVFKVETIGDSYVAVTGLPEPRKDHAIVMVKFARDCRERFIDLSRRLEVTLGPDTGDLAMRFGLHSGPTTAGVLRGQKSRFQLFGDTVNTASRMESTGTRNLIQVSQATADLIIAAKKSHWIRPRKETIDVKGKGHMQTYWAEPKSTLGSTASSDTGGLHDTEDKTDRLVGWVSDVMGRLVLQIIENRKQHGNFKLSKLSEEFVRFSIKSSDLPTMVLDEVKEVIELPDFDGSKKSKKAEYFSSDDLGPQLHGELREYVLAIARCYNDNPFHNFMHAAHVTMSVAKLMGRIVAPDQVLEKRGSSGDLKNLASSLHDHTYGITSDPLTQLGCVFAALIHDVDHPGIPNTQMVKEKDPLAAKYRGKSVAEQNSVDIAWDMFMDGEYKTLREAICPTEPERRRFRQLVVNGVMATDIMDKDLKTLRNARWDKAFSDETTRLESARDKRNRKATIVIEHLIQASDIAHTMQHWHVYRKWNERLFEEMSIAYRMGRADKDPAEFWYKGELGFFDFYIIPLTKKLSECGVFGVSSDELLNYAMKNREEWERRGQEIVSTMVANMNAPADSNQMVDEEY